MSRAAFHERRDVGRLVLDVGLGDVHFHVQRVGDAAAARLGGVPFIGKVASSFSTPASHG